MEINSSNPPNLKNIFKIIMDNCKDIDIDYQCDEMDEILEILDDQSLNLHKQLVIISEKINISEINIHQTVVATKYLLEQFTQFKPNFEDYYESSVSQFILFLKIAYTYRNRIESTRFYKTKSARALN